MTIAAGLSPADLYEYLVEARQKLLDWVRPITMEQYTQEFPFGKKTIRHTLVEIPLVEWLYGRRLIGESYPALDQLPFAKYYQTDFPPLEAAWQDLTEQTRGILRGERDWNRAVECKGLATDRPMVLRTTAGGLAAELILHEVHHRAQVMAMLRQLGIPAQNLDYSFLKFEWVEVPV